MQRLSGERTPRNIQHRATNDTENAGQAQKSKPSKQSWFFGKLFHLSALV
jgi:hypothetical protein